MKTQSRHPLIFLNDNPSISTIERSSKELNYKGGVSSRGFTSTPSSRLNHNLTSILSKTQNTIDFK